MTMFILISLTGMDTVMVYAWYVLPNSLLQQAASFRLQWEVVTTCCFVGRWSSLEHLQHAPSCKLCKALPAHARGAAVPLKSVYIYHYWKQWRSSIKILGGAHSRNKHYKYIKNFICIPDFIEKHWNNMNILVKWCYEKKYHRSLPPLHVLVMQKFNWCECINHGLNCNRL